MISIEGPTQVVGRALGAHKLEELALLHLPRAHKVSFHTVARTWVFTYALSNELVQGASCCCCHRWSTKSSQHDART